MQAHSSQHACCFCGCCSLHTAHLSQTTCLSDWIPPPALHTHTAVLSQDHPHGCLGLHETCRPTVPSMHPAFVDVAHCMRHSYPTTPPACRIGFHCPHHTLALVCCHLHGCLRLHKTCRATASAYTLLLWMSLITQSIVAPTTPPACRIGFHCRHHTLTLLCYLKVILMAV